MARVLDHPFVVGVAAVELVSAVMAWRDLSKRSDSDLRGPRRLWQGLILANPGNSLMYWAVGRVDLHRRADERLLR